MSDGSILAERNFYVIAPRNIWKLILFFSKKYFLRMKPKNQKPGKGGVVRKEGELKLVSSTPPPNQISLGTSVVLLLNIKLEYVRSEL
jgi:hypothetical protein